MRLIPALSWALVVLSALLQALVFPTAGPVSAWRAALCWFALVPLLFALWSGDRDGKALTVRRAATLGYLCGILWYAGNCSWIYQTMYLYGGLAKPVAAVILALFALYLGLYHALFAALMACVRLSRYGFRGALLLTPFAWVAVELARGRITGFPWDLLGNSQVDNLLVTRLAPLGGVLSISFLVAAVNAALASSLFLKGTQRIVSVTALAILAVALQLGGGLEGLRLADRLPPDQHAVLMQENLEVGAPGKQVRPLSTIEEIELFSGWSLHPISKFNGRSMAPEVSAKPNAPSVIVWPEAPSNLRSDDPRFRADIGALARSADAPVIAGTLGLDRDAESPRGYFLYDSASLFDPSGNYMGRYDKVHLVPWGEYIPFKRFFAFAHKLTEGAGDMDPGHDRTVFRAGGHRYGVFVCYESIFGDEVRQFVKNGAEVLVNISDDGWYGDTGAPWQHLNMARMRAIENHRWVLRSTNTGITTAIDPRGRVELEAPRHVRAAFVFPFVFTQGETFYTLHGDWFAYLCALVTVLAVGFSYVRRVN